MSDESVFEQTLCLAATHPALPGHFPGKPLAPGVLLLEHVAHALRAWRDQRLARVVEAKFMVSLLPEQSATVYLRDSGAGGRIRFEIRRDDTVLARGVIEGAA